MRGQGVKGSQGVEPISASLGYLKAKFQVKLKSEEELLMFLLLFYSFQRSESVNFSSCSGFNVCYVGFNVCFGDLKVSFSSTSHNKCNESIIVKDQQ